MKKLLQVLHRLVDSGATVVVVEHHPGLILSADLVIDLGPGAAGEGGRVVARGTPEEIMAAPGSLTGRYLKKYIEEAEGCRGRMALS